MEAQGFFKELARQMRHVTDDHMTQELNTTGREWEELVRP